VSLEVQGIDPWGGKSDRKKGAVEKRGGTRWGSEKKKNKTSAESQCKIAEHGGKKRKTSRVKG